MYKNILVNLPTNIGDAVMAIPVIDKLHSNYKDANITLICSKHTIEFLSRHTFVNKAILYNKRATMREKMKFSFALRGKYDLMIDLKNSALPLIVGAKHTSFFRNYPEGMHSKDIYLALTEKFTPEQTSQKGDFNLTDGEKTKWGNLNLSSSVFIACASNASQKRYPHKCLKDVVTGLKKYGNIIVLGQESDKDFYKDILSMEKVIDLTGKTKIHELFYLLKTYARLLVCVDSSILHIASYVNKPMVALFGQTDPARYGPWSEKFIILRRNDLSCVPCQKSYCSRDNECMDIAPKDVLEAIDRLLKSA